MVKRKIPLRKCTGCLEMKSKKELIRVVRSDDGTFSLDVTGKKNGRGSYICPNEECLAKAEKQRGLERSFKSAVPKEVYQQLKDELKPLEIISCSLQADNLKLCNTNYEDNVNG